MKPADDTGPSLTVWLLLLFAVWTAGAALMPVVQDEAYYAIWARHLAFGYFDHPPLVALLTQGEGLTPGSGFGLRLGGLIVAVLTAFAALRFFRICGLATREARTTAFLLANFNLMGLIFGFITTPDSALMLAWVVALSEAALALQGQEKRWLSAGAATGIGLLSKYTMAIIGPVFLWALIIATRSKSAGGKTRGLRSPWPYAGGLVAALVFAPNVIWNAQNDWITFRFQMRHGFQMERPEMSVAGLPLAELPEIDGPEARIAAPFMALEQVEIQEERAPRFYDELLKALNRYVGYYGSQVGLWGALLVPLVIAWRRRREIPDALRAGDDGRGLRAGDDGRGLRAGDAPTRALVAAAAATPLIIFGLLSLRSKVEANWSAMYIFGAAAWLAPYVARAPRRLLTRVALVNVGVCLLALLHAHFGIFPVRPHRDRILKEAHGYPDLAAKLSTLTGPVFAESYQLVAMTRFYEPHLRIQQWPGITRDSEFVRPTQLAPDSGARLAEHDAFWLLETALPPPRLPHFLPVEMAQLRDCKGQELQVISSLQAQDFQDDRCKKPIHTWYLIRYETTQGAD